MAASSTSNGPILEPPKITVTLLLKFKNYTVKPIDGCQNIPGITIPPNLMYKGGLGLTTQTIEEQIRPLFNVLDMNNIQEIIDNLKNIIKTKVTRKEDSIGIAKEFLDNFLVSDKNIPKYLLLLNNVHTMIIKTEVSKETDSTSTVAKPLGSCFIIECERTFKELFADSNISRLAKLNLENVDEEREYNSGIGKLSNLLYLFCKLYEQRFSSHVKLTTKHLAFVTHTLIVGHIINQKKMAELYDEESEEILDEEKYDFYKKIIKIYGDALYVLFKDQGKQFYRDPTVTNGISLKLLIDRFRTEVVPTLMEPYLISLCGGLEF